MSTSISKGKLLYHLTALKNIKTIFEIGLLSRQDLEDSIVHDIADTEILKHREEYDLQGYVPFHFYAGTPFAGAVQSAWPKEEFAYIAIQRSFAQKHNFKIIPSHPLSYNSKPLIYDKGIIKMDWELMEKRNYGDHDCKMACMAECITDEGIHCDDFFAIYVKSKLTATEVLTLYKRIHKKEPPFYINISEGMFKK